jgi:hypothetical protein
MMYYNISKYDNFFCETTLFRPKQGFCPEQYFLADGFLLSCLPPVKTGGYSY